jgi:hypothetical protein
MVEEARMHAFLIELENKPGGLAAVGEALGAKGINIENIAGAACGSSGRVTVITSDEVGTRAALAGSGWKVQELELVETSLPHVPGSLGKAARRLADAGVNIESILPTGMSGGDIRVGFVTSNPAKAKEILSTATAGR